MNEDVEKDLATVQDKINSTVGGCSSFNEVFDSIRLTLEELSDEGILAKSVVKENE